MHLKGASIVTRQNTSTNVIHGLNCCARMTCSILIMLCCTFFFSEFRWSLNESRVIRRHSSFEIIGDYVPTRERRTQRNSWIRKKCNVAVLWSGPVSVYQHLQTLVWSARLFVQLWRQFSLSLDSTHQSWRRGKFYFVVAYPMLKLTSNSEGILIVFFY